LNLKSGDSIAIRLAKYQPVGFFGEVLSISNDRCHVLVKVQGLLGDIPNTTSKGTCDLTWITDDQYSWEAQGQTRSPVFVKQVHGW
jgi:hypothetical protein